MVTNQHFIFRWKPSAAPLTSMLCNTMPLAIGERTLSTQSPKKSATNSSGHLTERLPPNSTTRKKREQPKFLINDSQCENASGTQTVIHSVGAIPSQLPPFLHQVPHGAFPSFISAPPLNHCLWLSLRIVVLCEHIFFSLAFLMWYLYTICLGPVSVQSCSHLRGWLHRRSIQSPSLTGIVPFMSLKTILFIALVLHSYIVLVP